MTKYELITNKFIESLNEGVIPWKKGWNTVGGTARNYITKREYSGINRLILNTSKFSCPFWATMKQINELGGKVNKGEKSTIVVFYANYAKEDPETQIESKFFAMKTYLVFNLAQTSGINWTKDLETNNDFKPIEIADELVKNYETCPEIVHNDQQAFYSFIADYINMPKSSTFKSTEEYYGTLFHEMIHSTGHVSRLNRETLNSIAHFGDHSYSKEELVAEIGASFLLSNAGLENDHTLENSKAYIQSWIKALESDPKLILQAASLAEKAVGYILGEKAKDA